MIINLFPVSEVKMPAGEATGTWEFYTTFLTPNNGIRFTPDSAYVKSGTVWMIVDPDYRSDYRFQYTDNLSECTFVNGMGELPQDYAYVAERSDGAYRAVYSPA